jgi:hypothetical protein
LPGSALETEDLFISKMFICFTWNLLFCNILLIKSIIGIFWFQTIQLSWIFLTKFFNKKKINNVKTSTRFYKIWAYTVRF